MGQGAGSGRAAGSLTDIALIFGRKMGGLKILVLAPEPLGNFSAQIFLPKIRAWSGENFLPFRIIPSTTGAEFAEKCFSGLAEGRGFAG